MSRLLKDDSILLIIALLIINLFQYNSFFNRFLIINLIIHKFMIIKIAGLLLILSIIQALTPNYTYFKSIDNPLNAQSIVFETSLDHKVAIFGNSSLNATVYNGNNWTLSSKPLY